MGHKDTHPLTHGLPAAAHHRGAHGAPEHHVPHHGDADPLGAVPCDHPEANCDCLWVDLGGEG